MRVQLSICEIELTDHQAVLRGCLHVDGVFQSMRDEHVSRRFTDTARLVDASSPHTHPRATEFLNIVNP